MYLVPISKNTILRLGLAIVAPLVPLPFIIIPLDQLIDRAISLLL